MKTLYLVRHAKAQPLYSPMSDIDRALSVRGEQDAAQIAHCLSEKGIIPDYIVTSPSKRTQQTAEIIRYTLAINSSKVHVTDDIYEASLSQLNNIIRSLEDSIDSVMLVGHNPGLSELAGHFGNLDTGMLPTCAVCGFKYECDSWLHLFETRSECIYYDIPSTHS